MHNFKKICIALFSLLKVCLSAYKSWLSLQIGRVIYWIKRNFIWNLKFKKVTKSVAKQKIAFDHVVDASKVSTVSFDELAKIFDNVRDELNEKAIIAVDFDGTLCEDKWPKIGVMNEELILWLIWRQRHGSYIILWTCREGEKLDEAVKACEEKGLYFDSINENLDYTIVQFGGNKPRKVYATEYIDDRNSKVYWKLPFHPIKNN